MAPGRLQNDNEPLNQPCPGMEGSLGSRRSSYTFNTDKESQMASILPIANTRHRHNSRVGFRSRLFNIVHTNTSLSNRGGFFLLMFMSVWGLIVITLGFYRNESTRAAQSFSESLDWGRTEVAKFLGAGYSFGTVVSKSEWSTFNFGTKAIPAASPAPPGTTVKKVLPPSTWLQCNAARKIVASLPEVTFVSLEEALDDSGEGQDLAWLNEWVAKGLVNDTTKTKSHPIDVVYTWVNKSSTVLQQAQRKAAASTRFMTFNSARNKYFLREDLGELRYSMRSLEKFIQKTDSGNMKSPRPLGKVTIVSTRHDDDSATCHIPAWFRAFQPSSPKIVCQEMLVSPILQDTCASETFSSHAVEARLDRLESGGHDKVLVLSDNLFLLNHHSSADLYSPLYGLPFVFEYNSPDVSIDYPPAFGPIDPHEDESPNLLLSAYLLHVRFGKQFRPPPKHTLQPMSRSILRELRSTFPSAFELTSAQRFRGESPAIHLSHLFNWYVIERHREALIWSYISGYLDEESTKVSLAAIRDRLSNIDTSKPYTRTSLLLKSVIAAYENIGVEPNLASQMQWSSADGPVWLSQEDQRALAGIVDESILQKSQFDEGRTLRACEMKPSCFEFPRVSSDDIPIDWVFNKWRKTNRECGDCMINALLRESGPTGLKAFLPKETRKRSLALRAIYRYSYSMSRMDARNVAMESAQMMSEITGEWLEERPGQVRLKDASILEDGEEGLRLKEVAKGFFERYFPEKSQWEM